MALSLSGSASDGFGRGCKANTAQPHGHGRSDYASEKRYERNPSCSCASEVLHRRSSRGDDWRKGRKGKPEPEIHRQQTEALFLSARRLPVPQRIATQYARSRAAMGGTTTRHFNDVIHKVLSYFAPEKRAA